MGAGMHTPWGEAHTTHQLEDGVYWAQTATHGGILIEKTKAKTVLSEMAIKIGKPWNDFLTFEQDHDLQLVFYEHPEYYPWAEEELIEKVAEDQLRHEHPEYFSV